VKERKESDGRMGRVEGCQWQAMPLPGVLPSVALVDKRCTSVVRDGFQLKEYAHGVHVLIVDVVP
jgi:hypothetical protein